MTLGAGARAAGAALTAVASVSMLVVGVVAAVVAVIVGSVLLFKKLNRSLAEAADKLAAVSGAISGAQARAEVIGISADMRRARAIEDSVGRATVADAQKGAIFSDIKTAFQEPIFESLADLKEAAVDLLVTMQPMIEWFASGAGKIIAAFIDFATFILEAINKSIIAILEVLAEVPLISGIAKKMLAEIKAARQKLEADDPDTMWGTLFDSIKEQVSEPAQGEFISPRGAFGGI